MLEFVIIAGSIEYLARLSDIIYLKLFSYINLYIFFMYVLEVVGNLVDKTLPNKCKKTKTAINITASLIIIALMIILIMQVIDNHSIAKLKH
jgi:hypothetical protein